jgi:hypothetical protein
MPVRLSVDQQAIQAVARAMGREADGKKIRRDLTRRMRKALDPAVADARASLMSMGSSGLPTQGEPLRASVARQVKAEARLSGKHTGVRVKAKKRRMPRGFDNAPKRLNSKKGWRRRFFGGDTWVNQMGKPGWFDDTLSSRQRDYRQAVRAAMAETVRRVKQGAR